MPILLFALLAQVESVEPPQQRRTLAAAHPRQDAAAAEAGDGPATRHGGSRGLRQEGERSPSRRKARRRMHLGGQSIVFEPRQGPSGAPLLRFAVFSDTHFWARSPARAEWERRMAAQPFRDGLLVDDADALLGQLLSELSAFAASGGDFAVSLGDSVCGGSSFHLSPGEYAYSLRSYRLTEVKALGAWPVLHVAGNHDLDQSGGGTGAWRLAMCTNASSTLALGMCDGPARTADAASYLALSGSALSGSAQSGSGLSELGLSGLGLPGPAAHVNYRSFHAGDWRVLLLDAQDGIARDTDGHGHIGGAQLTWMRRELDESARARQHVILMMHQLLVPPPGAIGAGWVDATQDFVDNRGEVLALLARYDHVRLSLHGHVHANSVATAHGIAFVTTASATEFPMHWREVRVHECELRLVTHALAVPELRERSRRADRRGGRNEAKAGPSLANSFAIRTCDARASASQSAPAPRARSASDTRLLT